MKLERKSPTVYAGITDCRVRAWDGREKTATIGVRAIKERSGKWRTDKAPIVAGVWAPWEPITAIEYNTASAAKTAVQQFAKSCKTVGSLSGSRRRRR